MSRKCQVCGKGPMFGKNISHAHNVTNRVFYPNVHKIRVVEDGKIVRRTVCTKCMKANKVKRA